MPATPWPSLNSRHAPLRLSPKRVQTQSVARVGLSIVESELRCDLEHRAESGRADSTYCGRPIRIASMIDDQTSEGTVPVPAPVTETVQHRFRPVSSTRGRKFERCSVVASAAIFGGAVKIAGMIEDQSGCGLQRC